MCRNIKELHQFVDEGCAKLKEKSAAVGKPITCRGKGCCHCCYEPVYCSTQEVAYILESLDDTQKVLLKMFVRSCIERIKPSGLFDKDLPPVKDWLAFHVECPFLIDGNCSIYERRPYACRTHMAIYDPDWCRDRRLEQKYAMWDEEGQSLLGRALLYAHADGELVFDNLLALLNNALGGEHMETASAQKIQIEQERTA